MIPTNRKVVKITKKKKREPKKISQLISSHLTPRSFLPVLPPSVFFCLSSHSSFRGVSGALSYTVPYAIMCCFVFRFVTFFFRYTTLLLTFLFSLIQNTQPNKTTRMPICYGPDPLDVLLGESLFRSLFSLSLSVSLSLFSPPLSVFSVPRLFCCGSRSFCFTFHPLLRLLPCVLFY